MVPAAPHDWPHRLGRGPPTLSRVSLSPLSWMAMARLSLVLLVLSAASLEAQELAPGPLATPADELNASFTPGGDTVYFTRKQGNSGVILLSWRSGDGW